MLYNEPSPLETRVLTRRFGMPNSQSIDTYLATDGYKAVLKAAGMKWGFVPRNSPKPKYIVVNADESEPGTCKDRLLMENDPYQLIEGALIAGLAMDSHKGYIYIRGEYRY